MVVRRNGDTNQFEVRTLIGTDSITAVVSVKTGKLVDERTDEQKKAAAIRKARALAQKLLDETKDNDAQGT